jgi:hypothetical protein
MRHLLLVLLFSGSTLWAAQTAPQNTHPTAAPAKPATHASWEIVVPARTTIPLELRSVINSRTAFVGQAIYCDTIYPITVRDRMVIPVGSYVKGHITQVVRPGRIKGKARLGLTFDSIVLPNGTTHPVRATLAGLGTTGNEGFSPREGKVQGSGSKGADAGKVAQTTITGAEIGTIAGAAGHDLGKGLGIGSAVGAAGGLIWVLASRGKEIVLPAGTNLDMLLAQPLTFDLDEIPPPSPYRRGPALPPPDPGPGA